MFEIRKNVPMCIKNKSNKLRESYENMQIGDSIVVPFEFQKLMYITAQRCNIRISAKQTKNEEIAIWRIA